MLLAEILTQNLQGLTEAKKKKGGDFIETNAPKADGKFRELSAEKLAKWLMRTRKNDTKKVYGSIQQQIRFNKSDSAYVAKMERTREIVKTMANKDKD